MKDPSNWVNGLRNSFHVAPKDQLLSPKGGAATPTLRLTSDMKQLFVSVAMQTASLGKAWQRCNSCYMRWTFRPDAGQIVEARQSSRRQFSRLCMSNLIIFLLDARSRTG